MNEQETPKKKWKFLHRLLALLTTTALLLGALFLVVNRDTYNLDALKRRLAMRKVETSDSGQAAPFTHGGGDNLSFACLSDGIVTASTAGIRYYTFSGDQYTERVFPMEFPVLTANGSCALAYNAGGSAVYRYQGGQEAQVLELEKGGELLSARVNGSGWTAVTAQESGYKGSVLVYDSQGKPVFRVNRSSVFVADAAVAPDCKSVAIITLGEKDGTFDSELLVFRLDREEPVAQVSLGTGMPLDLDYESEQIWVLTENELMAVTTQDWKRQDYSFGRSFLKHASLDGDGFGLVLLGRYRAGTADRALSIGPDGQVLGQVELKGQTLDCAAAGRYLCLLTGGQLVLYTRDMTPYRTLDDTQGARFTAMAANGSALLADRQQAWLYIPD